MCAFFARTKKRSKMRARYFARMSACVWTWTCAINSRRMRIRIYAKLINVEPRVPSPLAHTMRMCLCADNDTHTAVHVCIYFVRCRCVTDRRPPCGLRGMNDGICTKIRDAINRKTWGAHVGMHMLQRVCVCVFIKRIKITLGGQRAYASSTLGASHADVFYRVIHRTVHNVGQSTSCNTHPKLCAQCAHNAMPHRKHAFTQLTPPHARPALSHNNNVVRAHACDFHAAGVCV